VCQAGARWVQRNVLEPNTSADVRVYAVWFAMLGGDARCEWKLSLMPDIRVRHYWDEYRLIGSWFAKEVEGFDGVVWDAYYLYDAEARWDEAPPPSISSGATVIAQREQLQTALLPLLAP
jgi:hypothetical protein